VRSSIARASGVMPSSLSLSGRVSDRGLDAPGREIVYADETEGASR
jgi:hypothetical protein